MSRPLAMLTVMALALPLPLAAQTAQDEGEVAEVIVKIMTPEGPKWYRLGKDVEAVDVTEGKVVQFDYVGDNIEAITVLPDDAEGTQKPKSE